jgi:hypothetical protein
MVGTQAADGEVGEDARRLSVKFGADGGRRRLYRDSVEDMVEAEFDDWPVVGPRTTRWVVKEIGKIAEGPRAQHALWVRGSKIPDGDRAIYDDQVLSFILELAVTYDCLNVVNLACMEVLIRRRQLLAEAHVSNPGAPSYEGSEYFLGTGSRPGGAVVAPALANHVSEMMRADAAIMKERRKIAEARSLPFAKAPGQKPGPGGGGGQK